MGPRRPDLGVRDDRPRRRATSGPSPGAADPPGRRRWCDRPFHGGLSPGGNRRGPRRGLRGPHDPLRHARGRARRDGGPRGAVPQRPGRADPRLGPGRPRTGRLAARPKQFATLTHGVRVVVQSNATVYKDFTLHTAGAEIVPFSSSARVRLLEILSDPLVASRLLILGIYLVIFGISAPGHGAEIAGIIILLLALIGLGFSVDPIALLLFIVGVILIIIEIKTPGFGVFGIGGIIAIVLAAAFLAPLRPPRFVVSPDYQIFFLASFLIPTGFFGGVLVFAMYKVQQIRHRAPLVGQMVGQPATVVEGLRLGGNGYGRHRGELWQATADETLPAESKVYIQGVDGIVLRVSSTPPPAPASSLLRRRFAFLLRRKVA